MIALTAAIFVVFLQVVGPQLPPPQVQPPTDATAPGAGSPRVDTPAPGPSATLPTAETTGNWMYDSGAVGAKRFAEDGFNTLDSFWNLPGFLMGSRDPDHTVDDPDAASLNDTMLHLLPGLILVGFALVIGMNLLCVATGRAPNPVVTLGALSVVGLAGLAAVENRMLQRFPIDLVNLLLRTIAGAPIRDYAGNAMHVYDGVSLMWAAVVAIAFLILLILLTVVMFIEGAWCVVLGSQLGIFAIGSVLPIFGGASRAMIGRWMGSLFSPVIVFAALKLASAIVANLPTGTPDLGRQFLLLAFGCVAWQAPGLVVGAISVSFPGVAHMYFAGRMIGIGRVSERAINTGGGGGGGGGRAAVDGVRTAAPSRAAVPGGRMRGTGGGTAVTNRLAAPA